jgi:hypothetical protein
MKALEPREEYRISLIDKARVNGHELRGRFFVNGEANYVLRDEEEVRRFAVTEKKKNLVDKYVKGDEI